MMDMRGYQHIMFIHMGLVSLMEVHWWQQEMPAVQPIPQYCSPLGILVFIL